jgi:hypothetical protein
LPANADATKWQKKAEDWRYLATEWRSRYNNIINELALKTPDCKATNLPPPQKLGLHAETCLSNDYCIKSKPAIVTAGDEDFGNTAAKVDLSVIEDYVKKGAVTRMCAKALGKSVMETFGSPVALKSALIDKPGCLAAEVSEPIRLPELQPVPTPLVPDRACVAASLLRSEYEDSESVLLMDPSPAAMEVDATKELGTSIHLITNTKAPNGGDTPRICGTSTRRQLRTVSEEFVQNPSSAVVGTMVQAISNQHVGQSGRSARSGGDPE